jgi:hypothetical protein
MSSKRVQPALGIAQREREVVSARPGPDVERKWGPHAEARSTRAPPHRDGSRRQFDRPGRHGAEDSRPQPFSLLRSRAVRRALEFAQVREARPDAELVIGPPPLRGLRSTASTLRVRPIRYRKNVSEMSRQWSPHLESVQPKMPSTRVRLVAWLLLVWLMIGPTAW